LKSAALGWLANHTWALSIDEGMRRRASRRKRARMRGK
jgi:hypothetical protein